MKKKIMSKEVQKRWRSIRDSYTKTFRQGKCVLPEQCPPSSRKYQYHQQMSFLLKALQNKKPRYSQDKYESFSELSSSPQHQTPEDFPLPILNKIRQKPMDLKVKPEEKLTSDKCNQANCLDTPNSLEIKIDANSILPDDNFDDDKLFMNSLIPFLKKMDDDTRLLCRIEVLKIIRYALQGHKCFEALKVAEDKFFKDRMTGILSKEETDVTGLQKTQDTKLSMTTRSADGSRPMRKRRAQSPSPIPQPIKKRGPGRPRKIRPPPSDSDEDLHVTPKKRLPKMKVPEAICEEDSFSNATSVTQLSTPMFMKMYNLERSKPLPEMSPQNMIIKTEPPSPEPNIS